MAHKNVHYYYYYYYYYYEEQTAAFLKVVQFLKDNDDEQITLTDLRHKMRQFLQEAGHVALRRKASATKVGRSFCEHYH